MTQNLCPDCLGTGEFAHHWPDGTAATSACPTCTGTGLVADEDTVEIVVVATPVPPGGG